MSSIGIFGGTFDPIHFGHLITAQSVREIRKLEKIIFIPAHVSPFKTDKKITDSKHRLMMLKLAINGIPYLDFSDIEINSKSVSYTVDTLEELSKKYKDIELIIGMDNLLSFDKWKNPDRILELSKLVVLKRKIRNNDSAEHQKKFFDKAEFVETPLIEISAKKIRKRIKDDLPINFLVPKEVKEYIYKFNLYTA